MAKNLVYWSEASSNIVQVEVGYVVVGVYWDAGCTNRVTSIDWGTLYPGQTASKLVYIRNEGATTITLSLATENWNPPEAANYLSLSWDYDGRSLRPGDVVPVTLFLTVSPNIPPTITDFSFDIIISGYQIGGLRGLMLARALGRRLRSTGRIGKKVYIF